MLKYGLYTSFFLVIFSIATVYTHKQRPELTSESLIFKSELVNEGHVDIQVLDLKTYHEGRHGVRYFAFTDKGRLQVVNDLFSLNYTLYKEIENIKGQICTAKVSQSITNQWQINGVTC